MTTKCVLYAFISFRIRKIAEIENASKFGVRNLNDFLLGETVNVKLWLTYWLYKLKFAAPLESIMNNPFVLA